MPLRLASLLLPLGLLLTACGGDADASGGPADVTPVELTTSTASAAPTGERTDEPAEDAEDTVGDGDGDGGGDDPEDGPDTWATFTEEPGQIPRSDGNEVFADDPRVEAVRAFNEEFARAATAGDPQRADWLATLDPEGYDGLMEVLGEEFGKQYPGPLPFTVLDVTELEDGTGSVQGCIISDGFAVGSEGMTGGTVTSIEYALTPDDEEGTWLVQAMWAGAYDCSAVDVHGVAW